MLLFSTTSNWNLGDDFIREGVVNLLGVPTTIPKLWVNRCRIRSIAAGISSLPTQIKHAALARKPISFIGTKRLWQKLFNFPPLGEAFGWGNLFVIAGTPDWFDKTLFRQCIKHSTPVLLVGVGSSPGRNQSCRALFGKLASHGLIAAATARDSNAKQYIGDYHPRCKWFLDPAFHANYTPVARREKKLDVVLNYRADGGNGRYTTSDDQAYAELYDRFRDRISLITTHEAPEYVMARNLFPDSAPVFYSSDYTDYKAVYGDCHFYIGGRIHGCIPVAANGGTCYLLRRAAKVETVKRACSFMKDQVGFTNIHMFEQREAWSSFDLEASGDPQKIRCVIRDDFRDHQAFLSSEIGRMQESPW